MELFRVMRRTIVTSDNNYHILELVHRGGKCFNSSHAHQTGFFEKFLEAPLEVPGLLTRANSITWPLQGQESNILS